ncbi:MAG: HisA/HisF-related TIM barrel protein [Thermoplasmata archaeon]
MTEVPPGSDLASPPPGAPAARLVPILLLGSGGRVQLPGDEGPVDALLPDGSRVDLFDFTDYLAERFRRIYLVDLGGINHDRPQLDYIQEITRDTDVWVDGGIGSPDAVIDILVAGARRAVVSTRRLQGPEEVGRILRLTPEIAVEIEVDGSGALITRGSWGEGPRPVIEGLRSRGVTDIILSPRPGPVDWSLARTLAPGGPLWIDGSFSAEDSPRLADCGASGGFFHVAAEIPGFAARPAGKGIRR